MVQTDLIKLRNTLNLIEVRGESVKILSNCMSYLEAMIEEIQNGNDAHKVTAEPEDN